MRLILESIQDSSNKMAPKVHSEATFSVLDALTNHPTVTGWITLSKNAITDTLPHNCTSLSKWIDSFFIRMHHGRRGKSEASKAYDLQSLVSASVYRWCCLFCVLLNSGWYGAHRAAPATIATAKR